MTQKMQSSSENDRPLPIRTYSDRVAWALEKSGPFRTKFLYRFRINGGVTSSSTNIMKIPLKIKFLSGSCSALSSRLHRFLSVEDVGVMGLLSM